MKNSTGFLAIVFSICLSLVAIISVNIPKPIPQIITQDGKTISYGGTSPEVSSPYFIINGIAQWYWSQTPNTATTTVCAIQSPTSTSTLLTGSIRLSKSSTTASTVYLAKAATAYATTTSLGSASVSANAQATVVSLKTAAGGDGLSETFAPSEWFVVGMAGGQGTFSPTGRCTAVFREI
jgi:hypothetical protein